MFTDVQFNVQKMEAMRDKVYKSPIVKQVLSTIEQTAVMNYVSKFLSNFKEFYNEINSATLTGAIDVVIIRLEDGSYSCSPFHVRFGKIGVLRSREKVVDIEINGEPMNIHMKLGESGEAFFVEETEDIDEVPSHLATSPIPTYDIEKELSKRMANENLVEEEYDSRLEWDGDDNDKENVGSDVTDMKRNENRSARSGGLISDSKPPVMNLSTKFNSNQKRLSVSEGTLFSERDHREREDVSRLNEQSPHQGAHSPYSSEGMLAENKNMNYIPQVSPSEQSAIVEEDKTKKKKRRKRSTVKKRKGQQATNKIESSDEEEIFQMDVDEDEGTVSQSNSSSTICVQTRKNSSYLDNQNHIPASSVQANVYEACLPSTSRTVSHSWPYKSQLQLNLEIHPFSDGDVTPVLSPVTSRPPTPKSDTEYEIQKQETASQTDCGDNRWSWTWGELPVPPRAMTDKQGQDSANSDDDMHTKQLEQETDEQRSMLGGMFRFMRKTKKIRHQPESEGIYLDELNPDEMDPEIAKLYFPQRNSSLHLQSAADAKRSAVQMKDEDVESGNGSSLPQSPYSVEGGLGSLQGIDSDNDERHPIFDFKGYNDLAISLCGGLAVFDGAIPQERFMHSLVTYDDFCEHPEMLHNPDLVIRLNNKYYNWETVAPMVLSLILYQRPLSERTMNNLVKERMPKKPKKSETKSYSSWFTGWRRSAQSDDDSIKKSDEKKKIDDVVDGVMLKAETPDQESELKMIKVEDVPATPFVSSSVIPIVSPSVAPTVSSSVAPAITSSIAPSVAPAITSSIAPSVAPAITSSVAPSVAPAITSSVAPSVVPSQNNPSTPPKEKLKISPSKLKDEEIQARLSDNENINIPQTTVTESTSPIEIKFKSEKRFSKGPERFKKTLRLSSDKIKHLNLNPGPNEVVFSVTTAYQGTTRCKCHIYLWNYDDKIVISDIDGTITKSDVLGHILPIIGKDWAQSGVAQLFTKIKNNGYQFLYLSARAIGQAHVTREYLKSVRQGDVCLPDGPLLLNPSSLISAFHREVIEKKPEEFKISCLKDIQALFPSVNPFYAGYGNRVNDVWAYRAVGIPISRIFTINHKGELKHELTQTFQSTYSGLSYVVDHLFPPLRRSSLRDGLLTSDFEGSEEYSSFTYWRAPIPDIQIDIPVTKSVEKKSEEKKGKTPSSSV